MTEPAAFRLEFSGLSDVGRSRSRNEDSFDINCEAGLALVCDGMGGHAGGDVASKTAVETIVDFIYEFEPDANSGDDEDDEVDECDQTEVSDGPRTERAGPDPQPSDVGRTISTIRQAVQLANRRLMNLNQQRGFPEGRGMGTTVVGLWQAGATDKVVIFHAGDSRLYRLRGGELAQLTRDHSLYQAWLDNGGRGQPPHRNIIVRALGTSREVEPEVSLQALADGDLFLICSDGLSGMVPDPRIAELLREAEDLSATCKILVDLANENGGNDNITVVLARCRTV
ncbi:MAG: protein phosphatase 2C domain-containing protein [Rhodospirillaceae bacterium]